MIFQLVSKFSLVTKHFERMRNEDKVLKLMSIRDKLRLTVSGQLLSIVPLFHHVSSRYCHTN
ncbi:hypothetical protein H1P_1450019 [Hyella patelloides LEGE 07179]|uniref:Uncharacterized protein n=1 Tax=Hyella patelloides LEGE 07179 TaxID=945734 RepID=A0A563VM02_9CYAN|nr:hypothetical protein H1P_1450019 [Hyella patelloides LEGE 07179]